MWSNCRFCCVLVIILVAAVSVGADDAGGQVKSPRFHHASLAAYPNAVISLKDARTGMMFYVESDGRRLIAIDRDGKPAWGLDVFDETKFVPTVGKPVVRHLKVAGEQLWATCGKDDFVRIEIAIGKAHYAGAD